MNDMFNTDQVVMIVTTEYRDGTPLKVKTIDYGTMLTTAQEELDEMVKLASVNARIKRITFEIEIDGDLYDERVERY